MQKLKNLSVPFLWPKDATSPKSDHTENQADDNLQSFLRIFWMFILTKDWDSILGNFDTLNHWYTTAKMWWMSNKLEIESSKHQLHKILFKSIHRTLWAFSFQLLIMSCSALLCFHRVMHERDSWKGIRWFS